MGERKARALADLLFASQILLTTGFCGRQLVHMARSGSEGLSPVMFLSIEIFVIINLRLAVRAHRAQPTRVTRQTVLSYATWVVLWGVNLTVLVFRLLGSGTVTWDLMETLATASVLLGLAATYRVAHNRGLDSQDPMVRASVALVFKGLPQLFQGGKFLLVGGAGFAPWSIVFGHLTVLIRLGQLGFSIREAAWDRNRVGSAISELGNEASWIVATLCWLSWRLG